MKHINEQLGINIWLGIIGIMDHKVLGPYFFETHLIGKCCLPLKEKKLN